MTIEELAMDYCNNDSDKYNYVLGELAVQLGRELEDEVENETEMRELIEYLLLDLSEEE